MQSIIVVLIVFLIAQSCLSFFLFSRYRKIKNVNFDITKKYIVSHSEISKTLKEMRARVIELENHINETFNVSIRNDVTKVECIFNKVEMAFLMAGVYKLLDNKDSTIDDKEFYIKLYKKIQENIDKMEEEPDES